MTVVSALLLGIFSGGFFAGYAARELQSQKRRARARTYRNDVEL